MPCLYFTCLSKHTMTHCMICHLSGSQSFFSFFKPLTTRFLLGFRFRFATFDTQAQKDNVIRL